MAIDMIGSMAAFIYLNEVDPWSIQNKHEIEHIKNFMVKVSEKVEGKDSWTKDQKIIHIERQSCLLVRGERVSILKISVTEGKKSYIATIRNDELVQMEV